MNIVIDGLNYKLNIEDKTAKLSVNNHLTAGNIEVLDVVVHAGIEYTVTSIISEAFNCCENIKNIKLPDTIEVIEKYAFRLCESLISINIPKKVKKISENTFYGCKSLEKIGIPCGVEEISWGAFAWCEGLKQIELPHSVKDIKSDSFSQCTSIEVINIPKGINSKFIKNIIITENKLKHIIVDEQDLFKNKKIAEYVFSYVGDNPNLFNSDVVKKGFKRKKDWTLFLIKKLKPEIISFLFDNKICSLDLAKELLEEIEMNLECKSLFINYINSASTEEKNQVKKNVIKKQDIDLGVESCTLKDIKTEWKCSVKDGKVLFKSYLGVRKTPIIPGSIDGISDFIFEPLLENDVLTKVTFSNGVKSIEFQGFKISKTGSWRNNGDTFMKCINLQTIIFPETLIEFKSNYEIQGSVKYFTEKSDGTLTNIIYLGDTLLSIGDYSILDFKVKEGTKNIQILNSKRYKDLKHVSLPDSVEKICDYAFNECTNLTNINFPKNVKTIGMSSFSFCKSLSNVVLQEGLKTLGNNAFSWCSSLTEIKLPKSLDIIGEDAFYHCRSLNNVYIEEGTIIIGSNAFYLCDSLTKIHVPNGVKVIESSAFNNCKALKNILLPDTIETIGRYAFCGCDLLENFKFPKNIKKVEDNTFLGCDSINEIIIPEGVTKISENAFRWCKSLTSITLPSTLESIGDFAFEECNSLKNIVIPKSVSILGKGAFRNCYVLENVEIQNESIVMHETSFRACKALKNKPKI